MITNESMRLLTLLLPLLLLGCGSRETSSASTIDPCTPDPCLGRTGTVCRAGHCVLGELNVDSQSTDRTAGKYEWLSDSGEVPFEVTSGAAGTAEARFELAGGALEATLTGPGQGTITWNGVTLDGLTVLTPTQDAALRALGGDPRVAALALIPLELGCRAHTESPEQLAALLLPWQIGLKHFTAGLAIDPRSAASAVSCRYFASEADSDLGHRSAAGRAGFLLSDEAEFPVVFGYFPLDAAGAGSQGTGAFPLRTSFGALTVESPFGPCAGRCRGACGIDCPRGAKATSGGPNCVITESWECQVDAQGKNTGQAQLWEHFECTTAEGCRRHDACYDQCHATHSCGLSFSLAACKHALGSTKLTKDQCTSWPPTPNDGDRKMSCDTTACQCGEFDHGAKVPPHCNDWAVGEGPSDGLLPFDYRRGQPVKDEKRCPPETPSDVEDGDDASDTGSSPWPPVGFTTVAGTFPEGEPFNGLSITYSVTGGPFSAPVDVYDFTTSRRYEGTLGNGDLVVSGTVSLSGGFGAWVSVTLATSSGQTASFSPEYAAAPMSESFDLMVPVTDLDTSASFSISITGDYSAGTRTLLVAGTWNRPLD